MLKKEYQQRPGEVDINIMTYIVNDKCIKCKLMDCVEVCPVDCFYEGENMLVIHPDECIDCGVCEPECPIEAIEPDINEGASDWVELNRKYSDKWLNIITKGKVPEDETQWRSVPNKFKYFSEKPGS